MDGIHLKREKGEGNNYVLVKDESRDVEWDIYLFWERALISKLRA